MKPSLAVPQPFKPASPARARQADAPQGLRLFDVPVPDHLQQFGTRVRASALGDPNAPPVVVLGGISANCFPALRPDGSEGWWSGLAGTGRALDPAFQLVIGVDFAADQNGDSAPTTFEQAEVLAAALDVIGVTSPAIFVGASYGGMVSLALAEAQPHRVERLVLVSAGAEPHPKSTAARELQRRVVSLGLLAGQSDEALAIARGMAMLTYRSAAEFEQRFTGWIEGPGTLSRSDGGDYLRARGQAFRSVMSPQCFLSLSASIDRHRVDPERISAPSLVIGATSDELVFPGDLQRLASRLGGPCELHLLESLYGHDMFLKEAERVGGLVSKFLESRC